MIVTTPVRFLFIAGLITGLLAGPVVSAATCGTRCHVHSGEHNPASIDTQAGEAGCCAAESCESEESSVPEDNGDGCCDTCQYCCVAHARIVDAGTDRIATDVLANDRTWVFDSTPESTDATEDLVKPPLR